MSNIGTEAVPSSQTASGTIIPPYDEGAHTVAIDLRDDDFAEDGVPVIMGVPIEPSGIIERHGEEIAMIIASYASDQPKLSTGRADLALSAATALMNLGFDTGAEQVRVVSCASVAQFTAFLPEDAAQELLARIGADFAEVIRSRLAVSTAELLHSAMGSQLANAIGNDASRDLNDMLMRQVTGPFVDRRESVADHLGESLWMSFHEALRQQIGFTLAGKKPLRDLVTPFMELFSRGSFPIGFLKDGTFLVLTA